MESEKKSSKLAIAYPNSEEWKKLVKEFSAEAIAHKLLLAHVPFFFRNEPLKFALFRRTIADAFEVEPTNIFIVGSAMAGRSLKGKTIDKEYSWQSDIDTLIVSKELFEKYLLMSMEWIRDKTQPSFETGIPVSPTILPDSTKFIHWIARSASKGIWRPDSLPPDS